MQKPHMLTHQPIAFIGKPPRPDLGDLFPEIIWYYCTLDTGCANTLALMILFAACNYCYWPRQEVKATLRA